MMKLRTAFIATLALICATLASVHVHAQTGPGTSPLSRPKGGTGCVDNASCVKTWLGLTIGSDVQAWDADLDALAALSGTNTIYYRSGANTWSAVTVGAMLSFSGGTLNVADPELLAIAGLTSASGKVPYFTGSGTASVFDSTSYGRSISNAADAAALRILAGAVIGTDVQAYNANLAAISGLTTAADKCTYWAGVGTAALMDCKSWVRSVIGAADASAGRTAFGLAIGTDVQAYNARLAALAALASTANRLYGADGSGNASLITLPAAGLSLSAGALALSNDLAAIEALGSTGFAVRTASETWAQRSIAGTASEICATNGDGVSGNPTLALCSALVLTGKTVNGGTFTAPTIAANDNAFTLRDDLDTTKLLQFQLSGLTTGTTRTLTVPDASTTLVGTDTTQTLTNKTLAAPAINSPTGLVKADVGLGNVDNTSDAAKNEATATLSNKTLASPIVTGVMDVQGARKDSTQTAPSQITAQQDNYNPSSAVCSTTTTLVVNSDAARDLTGIAGAVQGCDLFLFNNGSFPITLKDSSSSSSAANRFDFGADFVLASKSSAHLKYDGVTSRWRNLTGSGSGGGGGGGVSSVTIAAGSLISVSGTCTITTSGSCTVGLAAIASDSVVANASGASAVPTAVSLPSCSGASDALAYNTTTHAFSCNTISGMSAATQAEQESASSTSVATSPGRQHYHPAHPKAIYGATITPTAVTGNISSVDTATEIITWSTTHGLTTGDNIIPVGGTWPTGTALHTPYFVNALSTTTFALYTTRADALADTSRVNLTSAGSGTRTMRKLVHSNVLSFGMAGGGTPFGFTSSSNLTVTFTLGATPTNAFARIDIEGLNYSDSSSLSYVHTMLASGSFTTSVFTFPNAIKAPATTGGFTNLAWNVQSTQAFNVFLEVFGDF